MGSGFLRNQEVAGQHVPEYWSNVLLVWGNEPRLQDPNGFQRLHSGAVVEQIATLEKELCVCLWFTQQAELATGFYGFAFPSEENQRYNKSESVHNAKTRTYVSRDTF